MPTMTRETWTDERLDDLNKRMGDTFTRLEKDIRELRQDLNDLRRELSGRFVQRRRPARAH